MRLEVRLQRESQGVTGRAGKNEQGAAPGDFGPSNPRAILLRIPNKHRKFTSQERVHRLCRFPRVPLVYSRLTRLSACSDFVTANAPSTFYTNPTSQGLWALV